MTSRHALTNDSQPRSHRLAAALASYSVDVGVFLLLTAAGWPLRSSHMASFAASAALSYGLMARRMSVAPRQDLRRPRLGPALLAAGLALFLRGGVLAQASNVWDWPPAAAILIAALASSAVMLCAGSYVTSARGDANRSRLAAWIVAYAFALRIAYAGAVELLPEETYYWNYARHLDIGYLDHPPLAAWLIRIGVGLWGDSAFGVRIGALLCAVIASAFGYRLTRNLFGDASAGRSLILLQALPFFFLAGFVMTPDAPLTAAWAAATFYLERALVARISRAWWGVGVSLGIGLISKYSIGLLAPVIALFMVLDRPSRIWWRRPEPYVAAVIALVIFSPVIVWNAQHEWASFAFQTSRRLAEAPRFALHKLIASALVLITPLGVAVVADGLARRGSVVADAGDPRRWLFLRTAILVPLAVFTAFSLRHEVKLDWTGAPWIAALPVMAIAMAAGSSGVSAAIRAAWMPTLLGLLLVYGAGLHYLALGLPGAGYGKHIELVPVAWREFSRQIEEIVARVRTESGTEPLIVGMDRYAIASELTFYAAERTKRTLEPSSAHLFGGVGLMYERWAPAAAQEGKTLLLVGWEARDVDGPDISAHSERLGPVIEGVLTRDGAVVRHYYYRVAYNYRSTASP